MRHIAARLGIVVYVPNRPTRRKALTDPPSGRHPLDVAGPDDAGVSPVVAVFDLPLEGEGDRLEATVGVPAHPPRWMWILPPGEGGGGGGGKDLRGRVVEHEQGGQLVLEGQVGEDGVHVEAAPHPVPGGRPGQDSLHGTELAAGRRRRRRHCRGSVLVGVVASVVHAGVLDVTVGTRRRGRCGGGCGGGGRW